MRGRSQSYTPEEILELTHIVLAFRFLRGRRTIAMAHENRCGMVGMKLLLRFW